MDKNQRLTHSLPSHGSTELCHRYLIKICYKRKQNELYKQQNILSRQIQQVKMGGDSFEGTEKLTNAQYHQLVPQILANLQGMYVKAQSYIPLPEKEVHGDIDFLMILKPEVTPKDIVERLKIDRFILNNNETINTVYKNKQVDFYFTKNEEDYLMARFYKSYSGIGAHLGVFLPSKQIKLSCTGLYALGYKEHIKFQFLLSNSVPEILKFYGLDYERYEQGFKTRKELFEYLRGCWFLNEKKMAEHDCKNQSKITKFFTEYLKGQTELRDKQERLYLEPIKDVLNYFNKREEYEKEFNELLSSIQRKQTLNKKFNATHLMDAFKIKPKEVNKMKDKFRLTFKDTEDYFSYIESNTLQQILLKFADTLSIGKTEQKSPEVQNQETKVQE